MIYESNNENDFAKKVIELYKDEQLQNEFGVNGKKAVEDKYNWHVTSKNLIKLYQIIKSKTRTK